MPILRITRENWERKTPHEKEMIQQEVEQLISTFRRAHREDEWHIEAYTNFLTKPNGIKKTLDAGESLFISMRDGRAVGITQFYPNENKRIHIQFMLTRPDMERSGVGKQLYAAVASYARTQKYVGVDVVGASPSGRNFFMSTLSLFPRPYFRKGKKVKGEYVDVFPSMGQVETRLTFGQPPKIPLKPSFLSQVWRRLRARMKR